MSLLEQASLVITPNAYKESVLYSVVPNTTLGDMDVVRATTATRINSAGLIEVVPRNLFTYSEEFDNAIWSKTNASITSNVTISPNGMQTANKLVENTSNASHYTNQAKPNQNSLLTYSVYAKKAERDFLFVNAFATVPNNFTYSPFAYFNLSNGTVGTVSNCNASILDVGNGWYRCIIQCTTIFAQTSVNVDFYNYVAIANNTNSYLGNGTSGIFIWGAQLEAFPTATEYFPTTTRLNIPRIDYTNGSCPSLLVEPQRTNLVTYSEQFDNANWVKGLAGSISANSVISPSGILNADAYTWATSTSTYAYLSQTSVGISQNQNTFSVWLKRPSGSGNRTIKLVISDVLVSTAASSTFTVTETWQRFEFTRASASITALIGVGFLQGSTGTSIASGEILEVWGAQLEASSYPTSYIPTVASSVTRNADVISKTGISSLIGQTEGTIFFDGIVNGCQNSSANLLNGEKNVNNSFNISYVKSSKNIVSYVYASGVTKSLISGATIEIGQRFKVAYSYKSGDSILYINGVQIGTSADTFTFPNPLNEINISDAITYFNFQESILNNSVQLYKTRLSNAELQSLTTL